MKVLVIIGYVFGALSVIGGLGGDLSALAFGVGLLAFILLATNARGLRAHVPLFNSDQTLQRRLAYVALICVTLVTTAMLPSQTPQEQRAAAQASAQATAQANTQATAQARQATAQAQQAATQVAQSHIQATAEARVAPTQTAQAQIQAQQTQATAVAQAHAHATAQAIRAAWAAATAQAQANANATAAAAATEAAIPTATPSADEWAQQASGDTYGDVNDHPDLHQGDRVVWTCNIAKFLGTDPNNSLNTDIGCWEYSGTYDGSTGDGEIILNVPPTIDTSAMHSGDDLKVYGTVDQPMQGTNGFGGTITDPQIDAVYLVDLGHDSGTLGN